MMTMVAPKVRDIEIRKDFRQYIRTTASANMMIFLSYVLDILGNRMVYLFLLNDKLDRYSNQGSMTFPKSLLRLP